MTRKKVAFISDGIPPYELLKTFKKMTPGETGIWKNIEGVGSIEEADYFGVIDRTNNPSVPIDRCIFLGAHPPCMDVYSDMSVYPTAVKCYDLKDTFGFGEYWINYTYDQLMALEPPKKTEKLACILSDQNTRHYHAVRINYMDNFCKFYSNELNLYGRINPRPNMKSCYRGVCGSSHPSVGDYWSGKEPVYLTHKYALEFDAGPTKNYFSERFFDAMLLWCMPIYWGSDNIEDFLPKDSFRYININGNGSDVVDIINGTAYENSIESIREARQLLLNKYNLWERIHSAIFGE